ncbi:helix-turn-helix domain-containing protein [Spirosoma validum]|uniref:Helix-turn-helix transcriptional regulator n=1 Tax=Spirosoma validum TaxID=2771355 RepID=A0A927B1T2_9BACT|nr:helix-turn-helix transcriptional regulator [Spirosoma validum]MBD2753753.1 helix-turn-helix transcriptional regulator [Spirosoma validum]
MTNVKMRVGHLIREARKAKGLTQKELGAKLGVSESTFNQYESGKQNLTIETLERVANAIGVDIKALIN